MNPTDPKLPKASAAPAVKRAGSPAAPANEAFDKEVDEELQREWINQIWEQYSGYILAAAVAIVLGVGAYKLIEGRRIAAAEAQGAQYVAGIKLLTEGKIAEGSQALAAIGKSSSGFGPVARLRLAAADAASGKTADAVAKYDAFSRERGVDPVLADFARLQTAMLTLDTAPLEDLRGKLTSLIVDTNPWRHNAREILGLAALKAGKTDEAKAQFEKLLGDQTVPAGMAERARIVMGSIVTSELASKGLNAPAPTSPPAPVVPAPAVKKK